MNTATLHPTAKLDPALCKMFAQYFLRERKISPFIEWAAQLLVEGPDTPSLRILAGLDGSDFQETEFYLKRSFQELGLIWPEEKPCLLQYCAEIASDIVAKQIVPVEGYNRIYQVALHLRYPEELLRWVRLEVKFYLYEDAKDEQEQIAKIILKEAARFLGLLADYQATQIFQLTALHSFEYLRSLGWEVPDAQDALPTGIPSFDDDILGLSFFRTNVSNEEFDCLTIPRTFFGRSEIKAVTFDYSDLSESRMCWNEWQYCHFEKTNLSGCDLRRSVFKSCYFNRTDLTGADLRGARFEKCSFEGANMKDVKLEKPFSFFGNKKAKDLKLSPQQIQEINWTSSAGEEPPGG